MKKEAKWQDWQKAKALEMYQDGAYIPQIGIYTQKSAREVLAFLLGRGFRASILFPPDDDVRLFKLYPRSSWTVMLQAFPGRTKPQITGRANALNIYRFEESTTRRGTPGMKCQEEYDMTVEEWDAPAMIPPEDPSRDIHPALQELCNALKKNA